MTLCDLCREPVKPEEVWVWEAGFRVCGRCEAQNLRLKGIPGKKESSKPVRPVARKVSPKTL